MVIRIGKYLVAASLFLSATPALAQATKGAMCPDPDLSKPTNVLRPLARNRYTACFDGETWVIDEPTNPRFTNRDRVELEVEYFNFLRYTLSFDVKEEKSESYQYLTKLWSSLLDPNLLNLLALGGERGSNEDLIAALRDVYRRAQALDRRVTSLAGMYRKTGLKKDEAVALKVAVFGPGSKACSPEDYDLRGKPDFPEPTPGASQSDPLTTCSVDEILRGLNLAHARLGRLLIIDNATFVDVTTGERKSLYNLVSDAYTGVRKRADTFKALAEKTVGVETKKAGKHEAGTRITLALSALDEGGGRTPLADVNYFVETTMPLVAHGGLAFSGLKDVNFDKVKRASAFGEEDLFAKTSEEASSKNFTAFLSWELTPLAKASGPNNSKASLLLSLGTDVAAPGKKIFAGPSVLLFGRMALTAGVVFGKEAEGQAQTLEPDVFRIVRERPKGSFFFSVTTKVH